MTIRAYNELDIPAMTEIWNEVVEKGNTFPQNEKLGSLNSSVFFAGQSYTAVALEEGKLAGLYILHPNNVGRVGHIANASYAVKKSMQGKGIGKALVEDSLKQLSSLGFRILQFNAVVATNTRALALYERLGFERLGTIRGGFAMDDMPCTAKKFEAGRSEMDSSFSYWKERMNLSEEDRFCDVDWALTTRELAKMLKMVGIDFASIGEGEFDDPLGASTGGAVIFASSGGVMEAALRTAVEKLTGSVLQEVEFASLRERKGIREAALQIGESTVKVAVANTLSNARVLLDQIKAGTSPYTFIEVMTCPDGCLGGGGQPIPINADIRAKRAQSIYEEDRSKPIRKSHEKPAIKDLYARFLDQPLSQMSHHLLHTTYTKRLEYPFD